MIEVVAEEEEGEVVDGAAEGVAEAEGEEGWKVVDEKVEGVAEGEVGEVGEVEEVGKVGKVGEVGKVGGEVVYGFVEDHAKERRREVLKMPPKVRWEGVGLHVLKFVAESKRGEGGREMLDWMVAPNA